MAWTDNIKRNLQITTGDGKVYSPKWRPTSFEAAYNIATFEFPNVEGTLVYRSQPKGRKMQLEIYFDGANHLEEASNFELSARDSRAWRVAHPYYGNIVCQPTSLNFDNSSYNVTRITGELTETIETTYPKGTIVVKDKVFYDVQNAATRTAFIYGQRANINARQISAMRLQNDTLYSRCRDYAGAMSDTYTNAYRLANSAITEATQAPMLAMQQMQQMTLMPSRFEQGISLRFSMLNNQFISLRSSLPNVLTVTQKLNYESITGTNILGFLSAATSPLASDYKTQREVFAAIDLIIANYNQYVLDINGLQTDNGGDINSYIPDFEFQAYLNNILNFALSNLFGIASDALQERSFLLEEDNTWVVLAHRLYGLDEQDENLVKLIEQNGAGLNEILLVRKGRKIVYYV